MANVTEERLREIESALHDPAVRYERDTVANLCAALREARNLNRECAAHEHVIVIGALQVSLRDKEAAWNAARETLTAKLADAVLDASIAENRATRAEDDYRALGESLVAADRLRDALRGFIGFVDGGYGASLGESYERTLWELARQGNDALSTYTATRGGKA